MNDRTSGTLCLLSKEIPKIPSVDASLAKAFGLPNNRVLGENANFTIRVDTYDLCNKTNLKTDSTDTTAGGVDPTGGLTSVNSDFGVADEALGGRTVQLQARFSF